MKVYYRYTTSGAGNLESMQGSGFEWEVYLAVTSGNGYRTRARQHKPVLKMCNQRYRRPVSQ